MVKKDVAKLVSHMQKFVGQKVAVLCARFQYRGVLSEVGEDYLLLANATAVEISGPSGNNAPQTEDPIFGSIAVSVGSVELFYQPNWVNAPLPGEA